MLDVGFDDSDGPEWEEDCGEQLADEAGHNGHLAGLSADAPIFYPANTPSADHQAWSEVPAWMQEHQAWWPIDASGCPYPWPDERWPDSELEEEVELQSQSDEELIPPLVGDEDSDEELVEELWFQDQEDMNRGVCRGEAEGVLG